MHTPSEAEPAAHRECGAGTSATAPSRRVVALLAVASGTCVANVYFAQPLVVQIGGELGLSAAAFGLVVTLTQIGYGVGLFLLVPLGDLIDRRRLVVGQMALLAVALMVVGSAPNAAVLLAGTAGVGLLAVVTQTLVAFGAALAPEARRGRVVGAVTSGIVIGILLARTVSGAVADLAGWRAVYLLSAVTACALALAVHRSLPAARSQPGEPSRAAEPSHPIRRRQAADHVRRYRTLVLSTVTLFATEPVLRLRGSFALLIFAAFSTLWSCVALPLSAPPYSLSTTAIGAFGLAGAAGAVAATWAGRWNDRGHSTRTTGLGLALLTVSWVPLALTGHSLWALAAGVVLLDFAVQAVHVTNQSVSYAIRPDAGSRIIGGYMIFYSAGSALGAITSTWLYDTAGWGAVCGLGAGISAAAFALWTRSRWR
ncbi:MFS transporter [Nocardia jejuensis]|uniref:MFS transporter n=1 Tax=Nocardia jejuensis TaxID=328049 RepID=UPI0008367B96|nr:MFS transporter [Nocardia jejuensis]